MIPNLAWCKQNFAAFNNKYFGGKLPIPKFSYNCPKNTWGQYNADVEWEGNKVLTIYSSGEMAFTKLYDRTEIAVQTTLLHEMIHMYCALVLKVIPIHDSNFNQMAAKMRQDGWNISELNNRTEDDVLIQGQEIPDMEDNQGESYVGGNQFFDTAQRMFGELQQLQVRLNKLKQGKSTMNECKKIIISEEQEKNLIKILKESDSQKRYCIDPSKVLLLKKRLDREFIPMDYERIKGGNAECIKIAGRLTPKTKQVIEQLYEEDLADWATECCKNMFSDKEECEKFAKLVVNRWLNNKIGVHGMLDVNSY